MSAVDAATQQQIVRQIVECGASSDQISMEIGGGGDLYVYVAQSKLGDRQINCLRRIARDDPYPIVLFEDKLVAQRAHEMDELDSRRDARNWLEERGLLDQLPTYDPDREKLAEFGVRMERFCELAPGSTLEVSTYANHVLTVRRDLSKRLPSIDRADPFNHRFECLLNAFWASNLNEHGAMFGFVGNEYVADKNDE